MRLRSNNSFRTSEISPSLKSSVGRNDGSETLSPLHSLESPESLTKNGKLSRVTERPIGKVSRSPVAQDEMEDGAAVAINRRITRGMNIEEVRRVMATNTKRDAKSKDFDGDKAQKQPKRLNQASLKSSVTDETKSEAASDTECFRSKLRNQDNSPKKTTKEVVLRETASNAEKRCASRSLSKPDTKHVCTSTRASTMASLPKASQKLMESQGVTTRQKTRSQVWPAVDRKRGASPKQDTGNCFGNSCAGSNEKAAFGSLKTLKRPFTRGFQEEAEDRFCHGDAHQSTHVTKEVTMNSELQSKDNGCRNAVEHCWEKRTHNKLDDPREVGNDKQNSRSHQKLHEQDPKLRDLAVNLRRSKRKRSPTCLHECPDGEAINSASKDVEAQLEDKAVQNETVLKCENDVVEENLKSAHQASEHETELSLDVLKIDPASKSCLVATTPMETGGRQMRARPLDLEQPLLVLVEGLDEDYYELDGGSFHKLLQQQQQQPECRSPASETTYHGSDRKAFQTLNMTSEKTESITIPSFRICLEPEDTTQLPRSPYILPGSYIKTDFAIDNCKPEYDMDEEDEEWLEKYNQSLSPTSTISRNDFEKIIDLLENRAADAEGLSSFPDSFEADQVPVLEECCICNGGENSTSNFVYECDSCHILVHQSCYGVRRGSKNERKKRKWNCKKCEAIAEGDVPADVSCSLCFSSGGALKPSTEPCKWAHVVCALYTNETYFVNPDAMEPIEGLDGALARAKRQRRQCSLCGVRAGSAERCSIPGCKAVFHVSCGVTQGACFELQHSNNQVTSVRVYCPRHAFEMFGPPKGRLTEGEKVELTSKHISPGNDICVVEEVLKPEKQFKFSSLRRVGKEILDQSCDVEMKHVDSKDGQGKHISHDISGSVSEKDNIKESKQREKTNAECMGGSAVDRALAEDACAAVDEEDKPFLKKMDSNLMDGVYVYWISKREKQGGPLLHRIQQGLGAQQFGIFNSDEDNDPAVRPEPHVGSVKFNSENMKVVAARKKLQCLQELSLLVLQRETLKLEIFSLDQQILKVAFEALNSRGLRQLCFLCKSSHFSISCTSCNKVACIPCLIRSSSSRSWRDLMKRSNFCCPDCEQQNIQMHIDLSCKPCCNAENDDLVAPSRRHAPNASCGEALLGNSQLVSYKKPFILLPRSDCSQQSKLATQAFWRQTHPKTVCLLDLLKE